MRALSILIKSAAVIGFVIGFTVAASAASPYGTWLRPASGSQILFYHCGSKLCGKVVAVKDQSRKSEIGTVIMNGATKVSNNEWKGDILDLDNGKTYSGDVTLEGHNNLRLKGCVLFLCRNETWHRVK